MGRKADRRVDLKMPSGAMQTYRRLLGYLRAQSEQRYAALIEKLGIRG